MTIQDLFFPTNAYLTTLSGAIRETHWVKIWPTWLKKMHWRFLKIKDYSGQKVTWHSPSAVKCSFSSILKKVLGLLWEFGCYKEQRRSRARDVTISMAEIQAMLFWKTGERERLWWSYHQSSPQLWRPAPSLLEDVPRSKTLRLHFRGATRHKNKTSKPTEPT